MLANRLVVSLIGGMIIFVGCSPPATPSRSKVVRKTRGDVIANDVNGGSTFGKILVTSITNMDLPLAQRSASLRLKLNQSSHVNIASVKTGDVIPIAGNLLTVVDMQRLSSNQVTNDPVKKPITMEVGLERFSHPSAFAVPDKHTFVIPFGSEIELDHDRRMTFESHNASAWSVIRKERNQGGKVTSETIIQVQSHMKIGHSKCLLTKIQNPDEHLRILGWVEFEDRFPK